MSARFGNLFEIYHTIMGFIFSLYHVDYYRDEHGWIGIAVFLIAAGLAIAIAAQSKQHNVTAVLVTVFFVILFLLFVLASAVLIGWAILKWASNMIAT